MDIGYPKRGSGIKIQIRRLQGWRNGRQAAVAMTSYRTHLSPDKTPISDIRMKLIEQHVGSAWSILISADFKEKSARPI